MAAPVTIERGPTERLQFLDAVRGFALLLMIVNHTSRWWQDGTMGWPRYNLIYATMVVGAPLFLFLVGFCLPLSFARRRHAGAPVPGVATKFLQRGGRLCSPAGCSTSWSSATSRSGKAACSRPSGSASSSRLPPMLLLHRRGARTLLIAIALGAYALFSVSFTQVTAWLAAHPTLGRIFLFEFAPWPWISHRVDRPRPGLDVGAAGHPGAPGAIPRDHGRGRGGLPRRLRGLGLGPRHAAAPVARLQARLHPEQPLDLARGHELPLPRVGVLPSRARVLPDRGAARPGRLAGGAGPHVADALLPPSRAGLTIAHEWLGLVLDRWWWFVLANALLTVVLVYLGRLWLEIRSLAARRRLQTA